MIILTKQELIDYCLTYQDCYEDYPFKDDTNWAVMRHKSNKKIFAMFFEWNGKLCTNLKCEPMRAEFLRNAVKGVIPGYHMNKTHWNTVFINEVNDEELFDMISHSYSITQKCTKKGTH